MSERAYSRLAPAAQEALAILRRNYHLLLPEQRPNLARGRDWAWLLPPEHLMVLALAGAYPMSKGLQAWVAEPPAVRAGRRSRKGEGARKEARRVLVEEGPAWLEHQLKQRGL